MKSKNHHYRKAVYFICLSLPMSSLKMRRPAIVMMMVGYWSADARQTTAIITWCRHQIEIFSALLTLCAGNSPVTGEFPPQRPVTQGFYVFFDLRLNKRLNKQSWGRWFETLSRSLWRHCNDQRWLDCDPNGYHFRDFLEDNIFSKQCDSYKTVLSYSSWSL